MNIKNFEKKEKNQVEITVEVTAEEFESAINTAYKNNKNKINIPGFRKGKAPRKIVEGIYGEKVFYEDALEIIYPQSYEFAVTENKLNAVGQPAILDVNIADDKTVTIKFETAVYPEVTLGEYKGISAVKPSTEVTEDDINTELDAVRKRNARIQAVDRAAAIGDTVCIDYDGYLDGVAFAGGKAEKYDLELGSGAFVPGFEDQIVGMSAGDEKDIDITFPENYAPDLAGKDVVFKIKVHEVKESILPEADDEFAKDVSEFDTIAEYKNSIKERLAAVKSENADREFKNAVLTKIIDGMECEVPDAMIDMQVQNTIQGYNNNLSAQGIDFNAYLQLMGTNLNDFIADLRPNVEKQIKADLAFEKIAELENFEITDDDIEENYKKMSEQYNVDLETVKKAIAEDDVRHQIKLAKAEELVFSSAVEEQETESDTKAEDEAEVATEAETEQAKEAE